MADKPGTGEPGATRDADRSIGALVSDATGNISRLVSLEIKLAKMEAKADAARIGKGVAGFAIVAVLAHIFVILLSVTVAFVLYEVAGLPGWASFGIVTLAYLLLAAAVGAYGIANFRRREGLRRTSLTTSRLTGILRGDIRPPGNSVDTTGASAPAAR
ncbi:MULTISPECIES: phage holin family protein [unclassified Nocardiopsis]|uniref:phage holin family protein n=1 Tax=unclassified Nocardiopsis TaxID=2649073 RepID=UPI001358118A|nr:MULTISPECIES: phage holin family protein [unclassified Nocardiopsis]